MPGRGISYGMLYRGGCQTKGCQAGDVIRDVIQKGMSDLGCQGERFHTKCYTEGDVRLRDARLGDFIQDVIQRGMLD